MEGCEHLAMGNHHDDALKAQRSANAPACLLETQSLASVSLTANANEAACSLRVQGSENSTGGWVACSSRVQG